MLERSWNNLLRELNSNVQYGEEVFIDLKITYSNTRRKYHNLNHIKQVILAIKEVKEIINCFPITLLAAWFHDYVYDPKQQDNEQQSANIAEIILNKLEIDSSIVYSVKQIILSTQNHQPLLDSIDNLILLDADLSILGAQIPIYHQYAQAIRQEYEWVSDLDYREGRKQVLSNFLARNRIYYTDYFYQKLEHSARNNLQAEIAMYL